MKTTSLIVFLFCPFLLLAQKKHILDNKDYEADRIVKEAAGNIVRFIGLPQNFTIIQKDVSSVIAYSKGDKRYIGYNPEFILKLRTQSETDWSAYSLLAHEIGHHMAGHTEHGGKTNPGNELVADHFSGFILYQMGATLDEAQAAIRNLKPIGAIYDTLYHPPVEARIEAISDGWKEAREIREKGFTKLPNEVSRLEKESLEFVFKCTFVDDDNVYYVDNKERIIWFNNNGKPIEIGRKLPSLKKGYEWVYQYGSNFYGVDGRGQIWNETIFGTKFKVGLVETFSLE